MDKHIFDEERERARDMIVDIRPDILGSDIDARCIDICKRHAKKAGVMVDWAVKPLKEFSTSKDRGIIVCNPPYGERLMTRAEADKLYKDMRAVFDKIPDWGKCIITANRDFENVYGKPADKRRKLSNGGMSCTLYQYFLAKKDFTNRD